MAAQVFDLEAVIAHAGQQQAAREPFDAAVLVDQFVRHVDRQDPAHQSKRQQPADAPADIEAGLRPVPKRPGQHAVLRRYRQQGEGTEPAILFQPACVRRRRIARVVADRIVGQRQQDEQEEQREPCE